MGYQPYTVCIRPQNKVHYGRTMVKSGYYHNTFFLYCTRLKLRGEGGWVQGHMCMYKLKYEGPCAKDKWSWLRDASKERSAHKEAWEERDRLFCIAEHPHSINLSSAAMMGKISSTSYWKISVHFRSHLRDHVFTRKTQSARLQVGRQLALI